MKKSYDREFVYRHWPSFMLGGIIVILVTVLALPYLLIAGYAVSASAWEHLRRRSFDAAVWRVGGCGGEQQGVRIRMVDDLLAHNDFHGMRRDDLIALLGEPEPPYEPGRECIIYCLGPERSFISIDYEGLEFCFDGEGRVREYRHMTS